MADDAGAACLCTRPARQTPALPRLNTLATSHDLRSFAPPPTESTSVKLKSKQEEVFEVEKEVACRSITVKNMVDDTGLDAPVPLPMVDSKILIKVIEYCKYHHKAEQESLPEDEKTVWDKDFVKVHLPRRLPPRAPRAAPPPPHSQTALLAG